MFSLSFCLTRGAVDAGVSIGALAVVAQRSHRIASSTVLARTRIALDFYMLQIGLDQSSCHKQNRSSTNEQLTIFAKKARVTSSAFACKRYERIRRDADAQTSGSVFTQIVRAVQAGFYFRISS